PPGLPPLPAAAVPEGWRKRPPTSGAATPRGGSVQRALQDRAAELARDVRGALPSHRAMRARLRRDTRRAWRWSLRYRPSLRGGGCRNWIAGAFLRRAPDSRRSQTRPRPRPATWSRAG